MIEDDARRLAERLHDVLQLARGVNSSRGLDDLLGACFRGLARALPYDEAYLALDEGDCFRAFFVYKDGEELVLREQVFERNEAPLTSLVLERGHPLLLDDVTDPKTAREYPSRVFARDPDNPESMRGMLFVPVRAEPVTGVLSVQSRRPAVYDLADLEHLTTLAELICVALKRVRWDEQEAILQHLGRAGQVASDAARFFECVLDGTLAVFGGEAAEAWELFGDLPVSRASRGARIVPDTRAAELIGGLEGEGEPRALHGRDELSAALGETTSVENALSIPVSAEGLRAVVVVAASRRFTQWDLDRARFMRRELVPYLSSVVLYRKLAEEAIRDPLTGAFNRRYFALKAEESIAQAGRYGHQAAFLVVDLERFSHVNDTHGHKTGDRVLAQVANAFQRSMRASDTFFRVGGDEFVLILPNAGAEAARAAAERCVRALREDPELVRFAVSANVGWAVFPTDGDTVEDLLETGDRRMYVAKTAGEPVYDPAQEA